MHVLSRLFVIVLAVMGAGLAIAGGWLISLGGSWYYFLLGLVWLIAAVAMWRGRTAGGWLVIAAAVLTVPWAIWEAGLAFWPLFTRLMVPIAVAGVAALFMPTLADGQGKKPFYGLAALALVLFVLGFVFTFQPHGVVQRTAEIPTYVPAKGDNTPSDWTAYARDTMGRRYSPFDQINRDTVSKLDLAWTFRTGRKDVGIDQNTPLQIGDTVYSCTTTNVVIALDPDKGTEKWRFDPQVKDVFWQRCRGIGYFKLPEAQQVAGQACNERLILTTIDARLMQHRRQGRQALRRLWRQRRRCLARRQSMGEIKPGFYFQTSAPLVARDKIVVGGWVVDNQMRGEPSGVIRAFSAVTGELAWAWDLGNPAITKLPPEGQTYTRGTPNMWTTASYDDKLGLIYAPLGNTTPDYYGAARRGLRGMGNRRWWRWTSPPGASAGSSRPCTTTSGTTTCRRSRP
jgi:quinate dehydrogenase (quinone)